MIIFQIIEKKYFKQRQIIKVNKKIKYLERVYNNMTTLIFINIMKFKFYLYFNKYIIYCFYYTYISFDILRFYNLDLIKIKYITDFKFELAM